MKIFLVVRWQHRVELCLELVSGLSNGDVQQYIPYAVLDGTGLMCYVANHISGRISLP